MKNQNFLERLASSIDRLTGSQAMAEASAVAEPMTAEASEQVYHAARQGSVLVLPTVAIESINERPRKLTPPPPPKVDPEVAWQIVAGKVPGFELSRSENAEIRKLQADCDKLFHEANYTFSRSEAREHFKKVDRQQWEAFYESGKDLKDFPIRSEDEILAEFENKSQFTKRRLVEAETKVLVLCEPIRARFVARAVDYLASLESAERTEAESLGVLWQPSARVQTLRSLLRRLKCGGDRPGNPKTILPFLKF